jgi:16S rRNA (adenine1518-N6/adenine1519-N6)-dimethyltransferase
VRIVANLPYSVSAPLLRAFLDLRGEVEDWSLMLQQDLVDRLLASKNTKEYGSLSVLHLLTVSVERKRTLKPGCFYPVPNVDSAFVRFTPRTDSPLQEGELARLERLTRAAFASRRKTLINSLRGSGFEFEGRAKPAERLAEIGLDVRVRAEHVTPTQFLALSRSGGVAASLTPKPAAAAAAVTAPAVED